MTAKSHDQGARVVRFRGSPASNRAQHTVAAATVATLLALSLVGLLGPWIAFAFFAVGAGAGYSLSGSV